MASSQARKELIAELFSSMGQLKRLLAPSGGQGAHGGLATHAQFAILFCVGEEGKTIKELCTFLGVSSSAATQLVDGLVRQKYLTRTVDPLDRRKTRVVRTPLGRRVWNKIRQARLKRFEAVLAPLSDKDIALWNTLQQKLLAGTNDL